MLLDTKSARLGLYIVNMRLEADRNSSHLAFFYLLREREGTFPWIQSSLVIGRQSKNKRHQPTEHNLVKHQPTNKSLEGTKLLSPARGE